MLDIVNHEKMSGQWQCEEFESGFIDPEYIYELDRAAVVRELQSKRDKLFVFDTGTETVKPGNHIRRILSKLLLLPFFLFLYIADTAHKIAVSFEGEMFNVDVRAGIACAQGEETSERLICMAKLSQDFVVPGVTKGYLFYEDIPREKREELPALLGRDISTMDYGADVSLPALTDSDTPRYY